MVFGRDLSLIETVLCEKRVEPEEKVDILYTLFIYQESKLVRKTNECVREKMNEQDTILDVITRKQLIWYGHVERMDPTRLPKVMNNWKPEERKKTRPPP
jgi:hypothetical protein